MVLRAGNTNKEHQHSSTANSAFRRRRSNETARAVAGEKNGLLNEGNARAVVSANDMEKRHPQHVDTSPVKPCPAAQLVLLSVRNAVRMGARTQLNMCPPGRARRELQAILRQRIRQKPHRSRLEESATLSVEKLVGPQTYSRYDAQEEEYVINPPVFDSDKEEDASSGDDEDLIDADVLFSDSKRSILDQDHYAREPLYTPFGIAASRGQSGKHNSTGSLKLPFNRRKFRYFDAVNTPDKMTARLYLQKELTQMKKQANLILVRHLQRQQREERKRLRQGGAFEDSDDEFESTKERILLDLNIAPLQQAMSPSLSAALVLESLQMNKAESIEGMAKCYDGIVNAGMALLEDQAISTQGEGDIAQKSRSQILSALTPLLISSLEQPSGEAIIMLAQLRRMCGTYRYQRRFVQRIAPLLIRPPHGAVWCLRHQNDMEPILVAAELILDAAIDIFSNGWYDRGQRLLADSKRAETLDSAAKQLQTLTRETSDSVFKLGFANGSHGAWLSAVQRRKDGGLNEREVVAVVQQIKLSVSNVMATDWSRLLVQPDSVRPHRRVYQNRRPSALQSEASPKHNAPSPRSPARVFGYGKPSSPSPSIPLVSDSDNFFEAQMSSQLTERAVSPPPMPPPAKFMLYASDVTSSSDQDDLSPKQSASMIPAAPPKSPKSPKKTAEHARSLDTPMAPVSPKRGRSPREGWMGNALSSPLSPANSVGTSGSSDLVSYRPSSGAYAIGSTPSGAAHYRTLTSTAAERKRTVAACRALRAQIQRFEDAFFQLHGRPPKGNAERAPLASTYAQYREWKRAIRADAACRIQALIRGARTRSMLLNSNASTFSTIVAKRPGRTSYASSIDQISMPADLDSNDMGSSSPLAPAKIGLPFSLDPDWGNTTVSNDRHLVSSQTESGFTSESFSGFSLDELQARKRDLKRQLRQYDMDFARRHGRMPVKAEKEPIRHLYESYNALKSQITQMEQDSRSSQSASAVSRSHVSSEVQTMASESVNEEPRGQERQRPNIIKRVSEPLPPSEPMTNVSPTQNLNSLRAEKAELHQMLRSYERDFYEKHGRQVSSFSDIRPVASQYRRYKEIKRAIAALQQSGM
ncbi:hypothetical protein FisN_29Lh082 [Fistulifera solaris]|uniref:FAM13A-like domain-containing protein n=1 Tax=Fistulifera solaris TaxID=1519565 RepID=A0A1Z5JLH8_FISSO|nr:hypothetical protein FisN_29Lh082 [Fistulifera solaris]|eukprot:GAX14870.1 hypothetical protein FisN_29Lh082 [Fistulifera solaris]